MPQPPKKRKRNNRPVQPPPPPPSLGKRLGTWFLRLLKRAALALLNFLWEQVKWALVVGAIAVVAYVAARTNHMWVASIVLWIGIFVVVIWAIRLLSMLFGGGSSYDYTPAEYDDKPKKRETWREREERDWQDMHDAYQREEEDRWGH